MALSNTAVTGPSTRRFPLVAGDGWQRPRVCLPAKGNQCGRPDMTNGAALDYMRVRALPAQDSSTTIEAEDAIPDDLAGSIQVAESEGASGGKYVVGMEGAYADADYLEFTYNAPSAGKISAAGLPFQ